MDINTALLTGAGTILCGVLVAIIFIFGFKEKTFEEALDEQRRGELLELIRSDKGRPKKPKKSGKKSKEKQEKPSENKPGKESVRFSTPAEPTEKPSHIEFKFPEAEVVDESLPAQQPQDDSRKKRKRDRVRPILHNREEHSPLAEDVEDPPPANHFDESLPKDDVMLKRCASREDVNALTSDETASESHELVPPSAPQPPRVGKGDKMSKILTNKINGTKPGPGKMALNSDVKSLVGKLALNTPAIPAPVVAAPVIVPVVAVNVANQAAAPTSVVVQPAPPAASKDKKKKKGELANLHQMISKDAEGVTMSLLVPLVRKAELSRTEVHQLIEQLLNREQGGGTEWVEGRQDPVARLKKQLADKERQLAEEQQGTQAVQAKLLEVRTELNGERQRQGALLRQLEEQLVTKQHELQSFITRLQLANEAQNKSHASAQQVQNQLAEERKKVQKLMKEQAAQGSISQELELHVQALNKRHQEEIANLQNQTSAAQSQIADLQALLQEQKATEKSSLTETCLAQDAAQARQLECEQLRQQMVQLEAQLRLVQEDASNRAYTKDGELELAYRSQDELKKQVTSLEAKLQHAHREAESLSHRLEEVSKAPPPAPPSTPLEVPDLSGKVSQLEGIIVQKDALVEKLRAESEGHQRQLSQLEGELEGQREKNNELRTKNWKAMEAVSSAEKNLEAKQKEYERLAKDSGSDLKASQEEQLRTRELLKRLFPDVACPDTKDHKAWVDGFERTAEQWLSSELAAGEQQLQASQSQDDSTQHVLAEVEKQNSQLQAMVTHYKTIIEDTEGMLNKLERHVEQEEARWRRQLQLKEEELEAVAVERDTLRSELQQDSQQLQQQDNSQEVEGQLATLQSKLQAEETSRSAADTRAQQLQARLDEIALQVKLLEQAKEERDALALQLAKESSHSQQLAQQMRVLEEAVALRGAGGAHSNHLDPAKTKDQTNATSNGPSTEPAISESGSVKK